MMAECGAKKRNGETCAAPAVKGAKRCWRHGSKAPQVAKAAAKRVQEQEARETMERAVKTLGIREKYPDIDPGKALLEEISITHAHVQWLRGKVSELEEVEKLTRGTEDQTTYTRDGDTDFHPADDASGNSGAHALVWGQTEYRNKVGGDDAGQTTVEQAGVNVWYQLYLKEREHLVKVTTAALKAGIEERRVRLAEQQGDLVAAAIRQILDALQLTPAQWEAVPVVVPQALRALGDAS